MEKKPMFINSDWDLDLSCWDKRPPARIRYVSKLIWLASIVRRAVLKALSR